MERPQDFADINDVIGERLTWTTEGNGWLQHTLRVESTQRPVMYLNNIRWTAEWEIAWSQFDGKMTLPWVSVSRWGWFIRVLQLFSNPRDRFRLLEDESGNRIAIAERTTSVKLETIQVNSDCYTLTGGVVRERRRGWVITSDDVDEVVIGCGGMTEHDHLLIRHASEHLPVLVAFTWKHLCEDYGIG